jgi:hypothetical protein
MLVELLPQVMVNCVFIMSASTAVMKVTAAVSPSPAYSWVLVTAILSFCQLANFSFAGYFFFHFH